MYDESTPETTESGGGKKPGFITRLSQKKNMPAVWSIGSILSLILNGILLIILLILATQLFAIKALVEQDLLGGLYLNFIRMDQATIRTTIQVNDTIPISFDLPINQSTVVILTEDTFIAGANISLATGGLNIIQAPTDIILPAGTELPIRLNFVVPVNATIPISLTVPVIIPLKDTELHEPFVGLQEVVAPYYNCLSGLPSSLREVGKLFGALPTCANIIP